MGQPHNSDVFTAAIISPTRCQCDHTWPGRPPGGRAWPGHRSDRISFSPAVVSLSVNSSVEGHCFRGRIVFGVSAIFVEGVESRMDDMTVDIQPLNYLYIILLFESCL